MDIQQFLADRKAAFLSMDKQTILDYAKKYGVEMPIDEDTFWITVHKARTGDLTLPEEERQISREWLTIRGYRSMG